MNVAVKLYKADSLEASRDGRCGNFWLTLSSCDAECYLVQQ